MSDLSALGLSTFRLWRDQHANTEHVLIQRPLDRIFAFTGYSIDDVVGNPIAKNAVLGYFKLYKQLVRSSETVELEKQWNG